MRALCLLLLATPALADTGEASLRPFASFGAGAVAAPGGARTEPLVGGGLVVGYGLSFPFTATLRYDFAATLQDDREDGAGTRTEWRQTRHALLAGVAWTPSDQLTPVLGLEAGAALRLLDERDLLVEEGQEHTTDAGADRSLAPAFRASAGLQWRFTDFLGIGAGAYVEHVGGLGYGVQLVLAGWRYL